jgi:hypothetical protein
VGYQPVPAATAAAAAPAAAAASWLQGAGLLAEGAELLLEIINPGIIGGTQEGGRGGGGRAAYWGQRTLLGLCEGGVSVGGWVGVGVQGRPRQSFWQTHSMAPGLTLAVVYARVV